MSASILVLTDVEGGLIASATAVSALHGITLARSLGWFEESRSVPRDELVALIVDALGAITGDGPER